MSKEGRIIVEAVEPWSAFGKAETHKAVRLSATRLRGTICSSRPRHQQEEATAVVAPAPPARVINYACLSIAIQFVTMTSKRLKG